MMFSRRNFLLNMVLCLGIVLSACNLPSSIAPGGTWYVDKTGDDSNDCLSATSACLTITSAVSKALTAGVIQIGPGIFEEISTSVPETGLYINNKVLTFRGTATGGVPETILSGALTRTTVVVKGTAIIIFQDLIIQDGGGSAGIGLKIEGSGGSTAGATLTNIIIQNNGQDGLFIAGRAPVTLDDVQVLTNGRFGLYNSGPNLTIKNSVFSGNTHGAIINGIGGRIVISDTAISDNGSVMAAIENQADMSIERSAISGTLGRFEYPDLGGAGIFTQGSLTMVNTTVASNSGAGIEMAGGDLNMNFSTVAENGKSGLKLSLGDIVMYNSIVENNGTEDCDVAWASHPVRVIALWDYNLSDGTCGTPSSPSPDPYLGHLADNDGPTQTMALTWGSLAINGAHGGPPGDWPAIDQRGFVRPGADGGTHDMGAYEFTRPLSITPLPLVIATPGTPSGGVPGVIPLYTDTPTLATSVILTFAKNAFCRKGPGSLYRDVSGFKQGDTAQADGRNEDDPRWWWVLIPKSNEHCWVSYTTVEPNDLAGDLPIQPTVSLELPTTPSDFTISKRACSQKQNGYAYALQLAWTKSAGADGYTLYRNGEELATFKANQTVYQENPPLNQSLHYELEAFNGNGFSERLTVEDTCP